MLVNINSGSYIQCVNSSFSIGEWDNINMNNFINSKLTQKDVIKDVIARYNCNIYPNPNNPNDIIFDTGDTYYNSSNVLDWSYKNNEDLQDNIVMVGELQNERLKLTYKQGLDTFSKLYNEQTSDIYGEFEYNFANEFVKGEKKVETPFSSVPIVKEGDFLVSFVPTEVTNNLGNLTLYSDVIDCPTGTDLEIEYQPTAGAGATTITLTEYPYAGHYNEPYEATFDINFGKLPYNFSNLITQTPEDTLFYRYWADYVNQISNGKLLKTKMYLTARDLFNIKQTPNSKIFYKDKYWHVNKIEFEANDSLRKLSNVELVSVESYTRIQPAPIVNDEGEQAYWGDIDKGDGANNNIDNSSNNIDVNGNGNTIGSNANNIDIKGDNNTVGDNSSNVNINGNGVTVNGNNVTVDGVDNITVNQDNVHITGITYISVDDLVYTITVTTALQTVENGLFDISLAISQGELVPSSGEFEVKFIDDDTSTEIASAVFNYGDDMQTATPISESNFTTLIQPYLTTSLLLQDGSSGVFDKLDFAQTEGYINVPYNKEALNLRVEVVAPDSSTGSDVMDINVLKTNSDYSYIKDIDSNYIAAGKFGGGYLFIIDKNDQTTYRINTFINANSFGLYGVTIDKTQPLVNGVPIIIMSEGINNTGALHEITYDGVGGWNVSQVTGGLGFIPRNSNSISSINDTNLNGFGKSVIFMHKFSSTGSPDYVLPLRWDASTSKYINSQKTFFQIGNNNTSYSNIMINSTGSRLWVHRRNTTTNLSEIRQFDITSANANGLANSANYSNEQTLVVPEGLFFINVQLITLYGTNGNIGDYSGNEPMFLVFGGDAPQGTAQHDDVKTLTLIGGVWTYGTLDASLNGIGSGVNNNDSIEVVGSSLLISKKDSIANPDNRIIEYNLLTNTLTNILSNDNTVTVDQQAIGY